MNDLIFSVLVPACSVCFGDPEAPMSQGLAMGVAALVAVTGVVLSGFVYFFVRLAIRGRAVANQEQQTPYRAQTAQPQPSKEQPC